MLLPDLVQINLHIEGQNVYFSSRDCFFQALKTVCINQHSVIMVAQPWTRARRANVLVQTATLDNTARQVREQTRRENTEL